MNFSAVVAMVIQWVADPPDSIFLPLGYWKRWLTSVQMSADPSRHTGWGWGGGGLCVTIGKFVWACVFINTHIRVYTFMYTESIWRPEWGETAIVTNCSWGMYSLLYHLECTRSAEMSMERNTPLHDNTIHEECLWNEDRVVYVVRLELHWALVECSIWMNWRLLWSHV